MHTKALKTLIRICEVESFALAANQLGITLSALSMQMKTLEQDLDLVLFDRSFRPPKLTPIGRRIAEQSNKVIEAESQLLEIAHGESELSGTYRIGFVATASVRLLPGFLKAAANKFPKLQFDLETGLSETLEEKVLSGQLDIAIVTASGEAQSGLSYHTLREEKLIYAIPKLHAETDLKDLLHQLPFLQFNPKSGIGKVIASHISNLGTRGKRTIGLDSVEAIMECVKQGIGFTMLPEPDVKRYTLPQIKLIMPKQAPMRKLVLASTERGLTNTALKHLLELFKA